jgi:hypothetical protein
MFDARSRQAWFPLVAALCLLPHLTLPACGAVGSVVTLPIGPKPAPQGLRLTLDGVWVAGYGYRPMLLTVTRPAPAKNDHVLTVEIGLGTAWVSECDVETTVEIAIPAASTSVTTLLRIPQLTEVQHRLDVKTWLDRSPVRELTVERHSLTSASHWYGNQFVPRTLFIAATPPDVSAMYLMGINVYGGMSHDFSQLANVYAFVHRTPEQLTEKWLDYSALDAAIVSLDDARQLAANKNAVWQALVDWARAGGTLCIFGVGGDWHGLEEVEQLSGCGSVPGAGAPYRGWQTPTREVFDELVVPIFQAARDANSNSQSAGGAQPPVPAINPTMPAETVFAWRELGFGRVAALSPAQPFPGAAEQWLWLYRSAMPYSQNWISRYGTVPDGANPHFNEFLIADVGLPPIGMYRVLITVFVVAIGPVNYWILRRQGRLHLFLFTVPLAAVLTSGALLAYAMLSDGFTSRLRARSLTHLDQRAGKAAHVARLSYYMGLAPSGGMTFPDDTMIAPLELASALGGYETHIRFFEWQSGRQRLTRGWLGSRIPTQYVTARAAASSRGLDVAPSADGGSCAVRNRLGSHVHELLLCDEHGKFHHGVSLAPDARATLVPLTTQKDLDAALGVFAQRLGSNAPALPTDMLESESAGDFFFLFTRRWHWNMQDSEVESPESLLESGLADARADVHSRSLAPRSYVAIVDRPSEIAVGIEDPTETQSLHVIRGTW